QAFGNVQALRHLANTPPWLPRQPNGLHLELSSKLPSLTHRLFSSSCTLRAFLRARKTGGSPVTGIIALRYWEEQHELFVTVILGFLFGSLILSLIGVRK